MGLNQIDGNHFSAIAASSNIAFKRDAQHCVQEGRAKSGAPLNFTLC